MDFVLPLKRVVIEVDGGYHNDPTQARRDVVRTAYLESCGLAVKRIGNASVLAGDVQPLLDEIRVMPDMPIDDWKEAYGFPTF